MKITTVEVGLYQTNCYIVQDSSLTFVIDPGDNWDLICSNLTAPPDFVVLTHAHFDHIMALGRILETYPSAKLCYCPLEKTEEKTIAAVASQCLGYPVECISVPVANIELTEGSVLGPFTVMHTPGHTPGSICLYSAADNILFSGDTLFLHGFGRTDLGGSTRDILTSLKRLFKLPPETAVYPGHGSPTTIQSEKTYYNQ